MISASRAWAFGPVAAMTRSVKVESYSGFAACLLLPLGVPLGGRSAGILVILALVGFCWRYVGVWGERCGLIGRRERERAKKRSREG